jgi:hypothetical protein
MIASLHDYMKLLYSSPFGHLEALDACYLAV